VVHVALEGSRPLLVELQSLVSPTAFGLPRRSPNGIEINRLHMLIAVLEKRAKIALGEHDVFVNAAGGVRLSEPAADLALALAIASNRKERPVGADTVAVGELGLSGEIRRVPQLERRLLEASRLGFTRALIPAQGEVRLEGLSGMRLHRLESISAAVGLCFN
jgi:DNA repair protein RadA/Sms